MADLNTVFSQNMTLLNASTDEFRSCIYGKLSIIEGSSDNERYNLLLENIGNMYNIYDLGKANRTEELNHIERLILKFIVSDVTEYDECFNSHIDTNAQLTIDLLCNEGISKDPMNLLGILLSLKDNPETYTIQEIERVTSRLLKYVPDIIKKIIEISEVYEKSKCSNVVSNNTTILKGIYTSLINPQNRGTDFDVSGFGIQEFLSSFNDNIITKSIMLLFLAYIIGKIIGLLNIHYNVKS